MGDFFFPNACLKELRSCGRNKSVTMILSSQCLLAVTVLFFIVSLSLRTIPLKHSINIKGYIKDILMEIFIPSYLIYLYHDMKAQGKSDKKTYLNTLSKMLIALTAGRV